MDLLDLELEELELEELELKELELDKEGGTDYRANSARMNFLSLDCPDLQFPSKASSREEKCRNPEYDRG